MLRTIFILTILTIGIGWGLRSRFAALITYVWFGIFRPQEWMWIDISAFRPSLALGIILVIPCLLSGIYPNFSHPLSIGAVLFFLSSLVAQVNAVRADIGWVWIDYMGRLLLVALLAITLINTKKRWLLVMGIIAISLGFHSTKAGLAAAMVGGTKYYDGLAGAYIDNNAYAVGTVMILPLLVACGQNINRKWIRLGFYTAVPLSMFTVVCLFSRGAFLGMAAAAATYVMLQRRRFLTVMGFAVLAGMAAMFVTLPEGYTDRVQTIQTYEEVGDTSAISRPYFWRLAVKMAIDYPLGVGLRNYEHMYNRYDELEGLYGTNRSVHSSHFQVLAENGFPGFFVYAFMFAYGIWISLRIRKRSRAPSLAPDDARFLFTSANAVLTSMVGFVVGGAFIAMAHNDITWLTFALVASLDRLAAQMAVAPAKAPIEAAGAPAPLPRLQGLKPAAAFHAAPRTTGRA